MCRLPMKLFFLFGMTPPANSAKSLSIVESTLKLEVKAMHNCGVKYVQTYTIKLVWLSLLTPHNTMLQGGGWEGGVIPDSLRPSPAPSSLLGQLHIVPGASSHNVFR